MDCNIYVYYVDHAYNNSHIAKNTFFLNSNCVAILIPAATTSFSHLDHGVVSKAFTKFHLIEPKMKLIQKDSKSNPVSLDIS